MTDLVIVNATAESPIVWVLLSTITTNPRQSILWNQYIRTHVPQTETRTAHHQGRLQRPLQYQRHQQPILSEVRVSLTQSNQSADH